MAAIAATNRTGLQWRTVRRGNLERRWPLRGEFRIRTPFYRARRVVGHPADRSAAGKSGGGALSGIHGQTGESTDVSGKDPGKHQEPVRLGAKDGRRAASGQTEAVVGRRREF